MTDPYLRPPASSRPREGAPGPHVDPIVVPEPILSAEDEARFADLVPSPIPAAQADRRNVQGKLAAGMRGLKTAIRGDSSFFAHIYRGTLIVIAAVMLNIELRGWCLLVLGACLVLVSELAHSAVDTLARAIGDPEEFRLKAAREIAAAGVLVAAIGSGFVTLSVLLTRFVELLGWRW